MSEQTEQPYDKDNQERKENAPGSLTHPPGSGDRDEDAIAKGEEKLDQAGGGH